MIIPVDSRLGNYAFDARPKLGITLGQFRDIAKTAARNHVSSVDLVRSLWLRAMAEVVQAHGQDAVLDAERIKKETQDILTDKIEKLSSSL